MCYVFTVITIMILVHRPLHGELCEAESAGHEARVQQQVCQPHHQRAALRLYHCRRETDEEAGSRSARDAGWLCPGSLF